MAKVHIILQGKGGVGKSAIAAIVAQYKKSIGQAPVCIDTDPVNATFAGYKALNVRRLNIMEDDEINTRHFDALVEIIATAENDVIIDNGASAFVPLSHYLISNQVPALLQEMGHELVVHTVITGARRCWIPSAASRSSPASFRMNRSSWFGSIPIGGR